MDLDKIAQTQPNVIRTYTGKLIDVSNPNPDDIVIADIAHALSLNNRWGGHTKYPYSVAYHSLWCAACVEPEYKLEALLHDATEAYIRDMPTPIKKLLPDYMALEEKLDTAIRAKFGLPATMSQAVKDVDRRALDFEWSDVFNSEYQLKATPEVVRAAFLREYNKYKIIS